MRSDIAGIGGGVVDPNHFARCGGGSGNTFAQRNVIEIDALVETKAEPVPERLLRGVDEQDAESIVIDEAADAGGYLVEKFVEIEDGGELVGNAGKRADGPVLPLGAAVELRIVNRGGDTAGDEAQHGAVVDFERAGAAGLHIDHADE